MLAEQALNLDELQKEETVNAQTVFNAGDQEEGGQRCKDPEKSKDS